MKMNAAENQYVFFRNDQKVVQFSFDPRDETCLDEAGYKYFGRVLNKLEPQIRGQGLVIYVTAWTVHELPTYGPNVISCILQDEWGREPRYRDKVGMVFKTCGRTPFNPQVYKFGTAHDAISNFLAQGKAFARDGAGRLRTALSVAQGRKMAPVYDIPLGYYASEEIDFVPLEERRNDLFFAGSVKHLAIKNAFLTRPKELARERMRQGLKTLAEKAPDINIKLTTTSGFGESIATDNAGYLQNMMNTKICPIPRGANLETFRFYEAIRYGCIPVGEALPHSWFYEDAPVLRLRDWSDIVIAVPALLRDPGRLHDMHKKVLDWWGSICSEAAVAQFMLDRINH